MPKAIDEHPGPKITAPGQILKQLWELICTNVKHSVLILELNLMILF